MPSPALVTWNADRATRLDQLFRAHQRVSGPGAGRQWETEQINWALVLRLAAEFQGFASDLHSLGVTTFTSRAGAGNTRLETALENLLTRDLRLDKGNATPASIGDAFNRLGIIWWSALEERDPRTEKRRAQLERLNRARNAIAHARLSELENLRKEGYPMVLRTIKVWRTALDALTVTMDEALAAHLASFFGQPEPW